MTRITKPLLAGTFDEKKARFPYQATSKIDGIRFLMIDGVAVSRSFKPIRNEFIQATLQAHLPDGCDGELTSGDTFQECGSIMRIKGQPNFHVWLFDFVEPDAPMKGYEARIQRLKELAPFPGLDYTILEPTLVSSLEELHQFQEQNLQRGFEGTMLRAPNSIYKMGRSTVRENILLKVKDFVDDEATIIGFQELMRNQNEQKRDVFGLAERSTEKDGMVPADTLGAFRLRMDDGREFNCGSGLNDSLRSEIWSNRDSYLNKIVKFKYQAEGVKDVPRLPIFLGFRSEDDRGE